MHSTQPQHQLQSILCALKLYKTFRIAVAKLSAVEFNRISLNNLIDMRGLTTMIYLTIAVSSGQAQVFNPLYTSVQYSDTRTKPVNITEFLDNRGFGWSPGDADFDGSQSENPFNSPIK
jgi:hypothetical protein